MAVAWARAGATLATCLALSAVSGSFAVRRTEVGEVLASRVDSVFNWKGLCFAWMAGARDPNAFRLSTLPPPRLRADVASGPDGPGAASLSCIRRSQVGPLQYIKVKLEELVDEGQLETVWRATSEGKAVMVKTFPAGDEEIWGRELAVLQDFNDPEKTRPEEAKHILKLIHAQEEECGAMFIMEPSVNDFDSVIFTPFDDEGALTLRDRIELFTDGVRGVQVLAEKGIVHRNIQPRNFRVTEEAKGRLRLKLTGFGFSCSVDDSAPPSILGRDKDLAHYLYTPPEIYEESKPHWKTDMWSMGIILYQTLFQLSPLIAYRTRFEARMMSKFTDVDISEDLIFGQAMALARSHNSNGFRRILDLLEEMLQRRPRNRIKARRAVRELESILDSGVDWSEVGEFIALAKDKASVMVTCPWDPFDGFSEAYPPEGPSEG